MMNYTWTICRRELGNYFGTPVAYVILVIFLSVSSALAFYFAGFYERGQADLQPFFVYHPWVYLFLIPAITMRLWAEERKSGSIELLLTLPVTTISAVFGKFLAAWIFTAIALAMTFPMWITVNYLGDPDNLVIVASYIGSFLMAGAYLAMGSAISAVTKNQVIAFIIAVMACFLLLLSGFSLVQDFIRWMPQTLINTIAGFSFLTHFSNITRGVIDFRDLIYFLSFIAFWLYVNAVIIEMKKAD